MTRLTMRARGIFVRSLKSLLGASSCLVIAALLSVYLRDGDGVRFVAPVICLQVVILVSMYCGRVTGLVGSLLACLVFTFFLFPPLGKFAIHDPAEVVMLLLLIAGTVCVAVFTPRNFPRT